MSAAGNARLIASRTDLRPSLALVLGSGLGSLARALTEATVIPYAELAGFPATGVSGHAGALHVGRLAGRPVAVLSGRAHSYESGRADAMRPPLETLKALGVTALILTNAAGSLRDDMPPGAVMLITDHINLTGLSPLTGEATDARFVGMSRAYDAGLRARLQAAAAAEGVPLHRGIYMWFPGPAFETPAEIRAARILGADAVGMSTVPEVVLARFLELDVAALSVVTNLAAGITGAELSHAETVAVAPLGGDKLARVLSRLLRDWREH